MDVLIQEQWQRTKIKQGEQICLHLFLREDSSIVRTPEMPKEPSECGAFPYLYWCPPSRPVRFYSLPCFVFFFFPKEEEELPFRTKAFGKEIPSSCAASRVESFLCTYLSWHNEHTQTTGMHTAAFASPYGSCEEGVLSVAQVDCSMKRLVTFHAQCQCQHPPLLH